MLNSLRRGAKSWIAKMLFALLVLSFAVWGIGDIFRGPGRQAVVASVGDKDITRAELSDAFRRKITQLQPLFDGTLDSEKARQLGLLDQTLQDMINGALFDLAARDLNLAVSDEVLRQRIFDDPAFRDPGGRFDPQIYRRVLAQAGLSEERFLAGLRHNLSRLQLVASIEAGTRAPSPLVRTLYRHREEKRGAETVFVPNDGMTGIGEPDDAAVRAFYEKHKERFRAPEYRSLTVVTLTPEDVMKEVSVSDQQLQEAYDRRIDEFTKPERREVRQILASDEDTAKRAYGELREGRAFEAVAEEVAAGGADTIDIGWVEHDELPSELADPVFSLAAGKFTEPIRSPLGWHIVEVTDIQPARVRSLDEVRDELAKEMKRELAFDSLYTLANQVDDELAAGATLEEVAAKLNLKLRRIDAIDSQGRDRNGDPIKGLPKGDFLEVAFSAAQGTDSLLIETPSGGYFVLRVDKVTPSAVRPLEDVRDKVVAGWQEQERDRAAAARAESIAEKAAASGDLAAAAKAFGLKVQTTKPFTRSNGPTEAGLPAALVDKLFSKRVGATATAKGADGHYAARLVKIEAVDPDADEEGLKKLAEQLGSAIGSDLLAEYGAALRARYPVEVSRQVFDATL